MRAVWLSAGTKCLLCLRAGAEGWSFQECLRPAGAWAGCPEADCCVCRGTLLALAPCKGAPCNAGAKLELLQGDDGMLQVDLDDMECRSHGAGGQCVFLYPCRCGRQYLLREADLSERASSTLVQCQGCSLAIRVLYALAS